MLSKILVLALIPAAVLAQGTNTTASGSTTASQNATSTSTSGGGSIPTGLPSQCVQDCSQAAAVKDNCVAFTNVTCVCASAQFQFDAGSCIQANCPDQLQDALTFQQSVCKGSTPTGTVNSIPFTATGTAASNNTQTGSNTETGTTGQPTNTSPTNGGDGGDSTTTPGAASILNSPFAGEFKALGYSVILVVGGLMSGGLLL